MPRHNNTNHVVLVGRLTRDPDLRTLPSGTNLCEFRVACNSSRKDAEGEYQEKPNFFDVSTYGGLAESIGRYMRKGSRVAIDGRLNWDEWETADQQKRQAVNIIANTVEFLDSYSDSDRPEIGQPRDEEPSDEFDGVDEFGGGEGFGGGGGEEWEKEWESKGFDLRPASELVGAGAGAGAGEEDLAS